MSQQRRPMDASRITDEQYDERERACIHEFDGGLSREEADRLAREASKASKQTSLFGESQRTEQAL